jgi:glutamine synthetase adenylyltransferase
MPWAAPLQTALHKNWPRWMAPLCPTCPHACAGPSGGLRLLAALADLGGVWSLDQVTGALTDLADRATHVALTALVADEIRRGKLPGAAPEDAATGAGMVVLAMGKMGARELNYSSDIDLICLFDETRFSADDYHEARASFIRVTRKLCGLLSDYTDPKGYVFRTDLRLRPDPSVTPVCLSMDAAERYYESVGRTWERAAYIKARPCAGDLDAGARFLRHADARLSGASIWTLPPFRTPMICACGSRPTRAGRCAGAGRA